MKPLTRAAITALRLERQQITAPALQTPAAVVAAMGAMQAQDYYGTLWAIGLRTARPSLGDVERSLATGQIVRTWPLRGTLHVVAAADVRWMLSLVAPRTIAGAAGRHKELELDSRTFSRSAAVLAKTLDGGAQLTRAEIAAALERAGISPAGQRLSYLIQRAALDQLICDAPRRGKQGTYTLFDGWVPPSSPLQRDEALARLASRYFDGHGPATAADFAWWAGQTLTDSRRAIAAAGSALAKVTAGDADLYLPAEASLTRPSRPAIHLLPGFDEYLLGYQDRSAALNPVQAAQVCPGNNGMFLPTVVVNGRVVGMWTRPAKPSGSLAPRFFPKAVQPGARGLEQVTERYRAFHRG